MKKIILALLISGAVILSGCGSSDEDGDGEESQTSPEQLVYCPLLQTIQLFAMPPTAAMQDKVLRGLYERLRWRLCRRPAKRGISKLQWQF